MSEQTGNPTPFTARIKAAGGAEAYWIEWNNLQIPIIVADYTAELEAGRYGVVLVDTSGLQKLRVCGENAGQFLDYLCVKPVSNVVAGRVAYAALATEDGMLRDDVTVFRLHDGSFLIASGTNLQEWADSHSSNFDVNIETVSTDWCTLSVFGEKSYSFLKASGIEGLESLRAFHFLVAEIDGVAVNVSRTGFSGGLGYELWIPWDDGGKVLEKLLASPMASSATFSGVGALDLLRTEAGYLMPGHDFPLPGVGDAREADAYRSPFDVGLDWLVNLDRGDFVGKEQLQAQADGNSRYEMFAVELDIEAEIESLAGTEIYSEDRSRIGQMFNGGFSLMFGKYIGMSCVERGAGTVGMAVTAGDEKWLGVLKKSPLYASDIRTQTPPPE